MCHFSVALTHIHTEYAEGFMAFVVVQLPGRVSSSCFLLCGGTMRNSRGLRSSSVFLLDPLTYSKHTEPSHTASIKLLLRFDKTTSPPQSQGRSTITGTQILHWSSWIRVVPYGRHQNTHLLFRNGWISEWAHWAQTQDPQGSAWNGRGKCSP